jgi:5-oxoprolinase (ATP-hydrolysing)
MRGIQDNAEEAVRDLLREVHYSFSGPPLQAADYMDDGSKRSLQVKINREDGSATFDFAGTARKVYGNLNAPRAIPSEWCLAPIEAILCPPAGAAALDRNVEISQRVTDLVLRAFQASGASQGTCNTLILAYGRQLVDGVPEAGFGYYEGQPASSPLLNKWY